MKKMLYFYSAHWRHDHLELRKDECGRQQFGTPFKQQIVKDQCLHLIM